MANTKALKGAMMAQPNPPDIEMYDRIHAEIDRSLESLSSAKAIANTPLEIDQVSPELRRLQERLLEMSRRSVARDVDLANDLERCVGAVFNVEREVERVRLSRQSAHKASVDAIDAAADQISGTKVLLKELDIARDIVAKGNLNELSRHLDAVSQRHKYMLVIYGTIWIGVIVYVLWSRFGGSG